MLIRWHLANMRILSDIQKGARCSAHNDVGYSRTYKWDTMHVSAAEHFWRFRWFGYTVYTHGRWCTIIGLASYNMCHPIWQTWRSIIKTSWKRCQWHTITRVRTLSVVVVRSELIPNLDQPQSYSSKPIIDNIDSTSDHSRAEQLHLPAKTGL